MTSIYSLCPYPSVVMTAGRRRWGSNVFVLISDQRTLWKCESSLFLVYFSHIMLNFVTFTESTSEALRKIWSRRRMVTTSFTMIIRMMWRKKTSMTSKARLLVSKYSPLLRIKAAHCHQFHIYQSICRFRGLVVDSGKRISLVLLDETYWFWLKVWFE